MKRKKALIAILITILILIAAGVIGYFSVKKRFTTECIIKATNTNNSYNNMVANQNPDLIQIDNKLYYNYTNGDCFNYGTYEITSKNIKRVYWEGVKLYPKTLWLDDVFEDKIMIDIIYECYFDTNSNTIIETDKTYKPPGDDYPVAFIIDDTRYFISEKKLYKYDSEKDEYVFLVSSSDLQANDFVLAFTNDFYFGKDILYYQTRIDLKMYICGYDMVQKKFIGKYCIDDIPKAENGVDYMIADGDDVYFSLGYDTLYHLNFKENKTEQIFKTKGKLCVNYYNNRLFLGVSSNDGENGVYMINSSQLNQPIQICEKPAEGVYILDEEYVYYIDDEYYLYRVSLDGNTLEKVFG